MYDPNPDAPHPYAEKRGYPRVPFLRPVTITAQPGGRPVEARTLDISLEGVGLTCAASFAKGQAVTVTFRLKGANHDLVEERVAGRVTNFQADLDANRVGVVFGERLDHSSHPALTREVGRL